MGFGSESTRHIQAFRGPNVKRSKRSEFGDGYGMLWALWHGMLWIQNTRPVQEVSEVSSAGFIVRKDVKRWTMYNKSALWICTCRIWYARIYRHYFYIMYACKWHISIYIYMHTYIRVQTYIRAWPYTAYLAMLSGRLIQICRTRQVLRVTCTSWHLAFASCMANVCFLAQTHLKHEDVKYQSNLCIFLEKP